MKRGLIGNPLGHSLSPLIHQEISAKEYQLFEITKDELGPFLAKKDFDGLNVTIPYKQEVIAYLDEIDEKAKRIGAVNTVVNKNGRLIGYNTDYDGFSGLLDYNQIDVFNQTVLILGNGGTSKTVYTVIKDRLAKKIYKVHLDKDEQNPAESLITYDELAQNPNLRNEITIIVNTTPVGMYPNINQSLLDLNDFPGVRAVIDVIYNPLKTNLILQAKQKGLKYATGLLMLIIQAKYSAEYFDNQKIDNQINNFTQIGKLYQKLIFELGNLVLIGMPGSGKSTIGKLISQKLNLNFIDLDKAFTEEFHQTPAEVIKNEGVSEFRNKETIVAKKYHQLKKTVIATGGGIVTIPTNYDLFKHQAIIVCLNRKPNSQTLKNNRPLSKDLQAWEELYKIRKPLYEQWADYQISSMPNKNETAQKVIDVLEEFKTNEKENNT